MDVPEKKQKIQSARVAVAKYYPGKPLPPLPASNEGGTWKNILIHTSPKDVGGPLSPYLLKNEQGQLLENVWQFSKVYKHVSKQRTPLNGKYRPDVIIWEHPEEVHVNDDTGEVNDAYWAWRQKGMNNAYAVRYPNGFHGRKECVCSVIQNKHIIDGKEVVTLERLNYIEARKRIYCAEYARLAPRTQAFKQLRDLLAQGISLQLVEVDGPDPTLSYPPYDSISKEKPGMLMDEATIRLLVNDARKPFGHGFVIAALLLDGAEWIK